MSYHFNKIAIFSRSSNQKSNDIIVRLYQFLQRHNINFVIEENVANNLQLQEHALSATAICEQCDLAIVVGGDGSILDASRIIAGSNISVVGINGGHLGFLADLPPEAFDDMLLEILQGNYLKFELFLLHATIQHNDDITSTHAVNDIVLNAGNISRMIEFELHINQTFVYKQRSDGLIIATPTGSTAYALSGGGPVLHPQLNATVIVPMFAHNLTSRPIVIDANATLEILITKCCGDHAGVSYDGQSPVAVHENSKITIKKSKKTLTIIHPNNYSYYQTLREKLNWQRQLNY